VRQNNQGDFDELEDLKEQRRVQFCEGFKHIATAHQEIYKEISNDGDSTLDLVNLSNPFSEGVNFSVRPRGKGWHETEDEIKKLSGGERTLASLALVFALYQYKPSPFYCMDEIDAALDYKNVYKIGQYIHRKAQRSQFIVISLREQMQEAAKLYIGIYKLNDVTSTINMDP
jgi:structural maintenance of chromosome 4